MLLYYEIVRGTPEITEERKKEKRNTPVRDRLLRARARACVEYDVIRRNDSDLVSDENHTRVSRL